MKGLFVVTIIFLAYFELHGYSSNIQGTILDCDSEPIPNVYIHLSGSPIGTLSNNQGAFILKIPEEYCGLNMTFDHIEYKQVFQTILCDNSEIFVILTKRRVEEIKKNKLTAKQIMNSVINNLELNYGGQEINYSLFSRSTEETNKEPLLIEEFAVDLYQTDNTHRPDYKINRVRTHAYNELGQQRLSITPLISIQSVEYHFMTLFIPNFLNKRKMKLFDYTLVKEIHSDNRSYYVIAVESDYYEKQSVIYVDKADYGIFYMKILFQDQKENTYSKTNRILESHFEKYNRKWLFTHGTSQYIFKIINEGIEIRKQNVTVATTHGYKKVPSLNEQNTSMHQMLDEFSCDIEPEFWVDYNYIPVSSNFIQGNNDSIR